MWQLIEHLSSFLKTVNVFENSTKKVQKYTNKTNNSSKKVSDGLSQDRVQQGLGNEIRDNSRMQEHTTCRVWFAINGGLPYESLNLILSLPSCNAEMSKNHKEYLKIRKIHIDIRTKLPGKYAFGTSVSHVHIKIMDEWIRNRGKHVNGNRIINDIVQNY